MDDEVKITIAGVSGLPPETQLALADLLSRHGTNLVQEAGRLEAESNSGTGAPMITPAMIGHADIWHKMGYARTRRSGTSRNWMIISQFATFAGGHFTNNIVKPWGAIGFVICALVAFISFSKGSE